MSRILKLFLLAIVFGSCAPRPYMSANMEQVIDKHKVVAILPPRVSIQLRPNQMKRIPEDQLRDMEKRMAYNVQESIYSWMMQKRNLRYSVRIEDIAVTNSKLREQGFDYYSLWDNDAKDIAKALEVDGMIDMNISTDKPVSEGAAVALLFLGFVSVTNHTHVVTSVRDGSSGDLLWRMSLNEDGNSGSSAEQLTTYVMKRAARRFPYRLRR